MALNRRNTLNKLRKLRKAPLAIVLGLLVLFGSAVTAGADPHPQTTPPGKPAPVQPGGAKSEAPLSPATSGFTYQGSLKDGQSPANGQYDLVFTLYDALSGGNQISTPITITNQTVTNGLFTVTLDYGAGAFQGDGRWLQIAVRQSGGGSPTTLSPRQALTASPYALSLAPGAIISGTVGSQVLTVNNTGTGNGLSATTVGGTQTAGVYGRSTSSNGTGVIGEADTGTSANGVEGISNSGIGVYGTSTNGVGLQASSANSYAIVGSSSNGYAAIYGSNNGGSGPGVAGRSTNGFGLDAFSTNSSGLEASSTNSSAIVGSSSNGWATIFGSNSSSGPGVQASSGSGTGISASGSTYGVSATGSITDGVGVYGEADSGTNSKGVYGVSTNGWGVFGTSTNGTGVYGNGHTYGLYGNSGTSGIGVYGNGGNFGLYGNSTGTGGSGVYGTGGSGGYGVYGTGGTYGVYGTGGSWGLSGFSSTGVGLQATSTTGVGVFGATSNPNGNYAGYFSGNVNVSGQLFAGVKDFKIDDPLDPANKFLVHTSVESPDMMDIYNGNVTTDANGDAIVDLPDYFQALNRDFRYQLTPIGQFAQAMVSSKIADNRFTIKTDKPNVEVSWQVTGVRHDPYALAHPTQPEQDKPADQQGKYLYPKEYGQPESKGIDYQQRQQAQAQQPGAAVPSPEPSHGH
jgi:hypothetical protein